MRLARKQTELSNHDRHREATSKQEPSGTIVRLSKCMLCLSVLAIFACGCTSLREYVQNRFKVGPNYGRPPAPVAHDWIDASDQRIRKTSDDLSKWWTVFNDPALNNLICFAYHQNLTLRQAGFRVLEARAQLAIDAGNLFPQNQNLSGSYVRTGLSAETASGKNIASRFFNQWNYGFNLNWELDFWGRFRRTIESDRATLDASVENYDDALVTMLSDIATNYTTMRTTEERIKFAKQNVEIQRETLTIVEGRFKAGTTNALDVDQARSTLEQTQAQIPELEIALRQSITELCILLGIPPEDLRARIGPAPIPVAPVEVAVGIPADLLRRRPDVRHAERQAAAQCALIGVAESEFYPHIAINGTIGLQAQNFSDLFRSKATAGTIGPSFAWNILNYGRIVNNVRLQDARFQELVAAYQQAVLAANQDVENGLITFLSAQQRVKLQAASVEDAEKAVKIAIAQYKEGVVDLTRVTLLQQNLVQLQDTLAQAQGEIASGLIQVYKALGGGWELRLTDCQPTMPGFQADNMNQAPVAPTETSKMLPKPSPAPAAPKPASKDLPGIELMPKKPLGPALDIVLPTPDELKKKDCQPRPIDEPKLPTTGVELDWKGVDK